MAQLKPVFQNIADAIREKNGLADTYTPEQMPDAIKAIPTAGGGSKNERLEIVSNGTYKAPEGVGYSPVVVNVPQDGAPTAEELTLTGGCQNLFSGNKWDWFLKKYGNQITTKNIVSTNFMFNASEIDNIPFEINGKPNYTVTWDYMFYSARNLKMLPKINNFRIQSPQRPFSDCNSLIEIPKGYFDGFDFSLIDTQNSGSSIYDMVFTHCYELRRFDNTLFKHQPHATYTSYAYQQAFSRCENLDEIIDLPNPYWKDSPKSSNMFNQAFTLCCHLKDFTFAPTMTNGSPNSPAWTNQVINLAAQVGYFDPHVYCTLPPEKKMFDDASYQQYRNDVDAWASSIEYSRYNHDSAVRTINSLPDTSASVGSGGNTNIIKFQGASGSKTDGGAINTLTPEEIAVADAKGWTVSLV